MTRIGRRALVATTSMLATAAALTGCTAPSAPSSSTATPRIARAWVEAWTGDDPAALGALFTEDATYRDTAVMKSSRGRAAITAWKRGTGELIPGASFRLDHAFRQAESAATVGTYSGRIVSAPEAFSVPMVAVLQLHGARVVTDTNYYNLTEVLRQSGLPPTASSEARP